jgi:hypothetical protein
MRKELTEKLYNKYPKMFKQHSLPLTQTAMCWGFQCDDGWYDLIDNLCYRIQTTIDLNPGKYPQIEVTTVKEKYGTLRFYYSPYNAYFDGMVEMAEQMSGITCEICGSTEKVEQTKGYILTLCKKCIKSRDKTKQKPRGNTSALDLMIGGKNEKENK